MLTEHNVGNSDKKSLINDYFESKETILPPKSKGTYAKRKRILKTITWTGWIFLSILYAIVGILAIGVTHGILTVKRILESVGYKGNGDNGEILQISEEAGGTFLNELPALYDNRMDFIIFYIIIPITIAIITTIILLILRRLLEKKLFKNM